MDALEQGQVDVLVGIGPQIVELCGKGPDIVEELLAGNSVEHRGIERQAVGLVRLQVQRAPIVEHVAPGQFRPLAKVSNYFTYGDLIATARISELLAGRGKPFQILSDRLTTHRDLRGESTILLGRFNNQ